MRGRGLVRAAVAAVVLLAPAPLLAQADLVIDQGALASSWHVQDVLIPAGSCSLAEACVGAPGIRRLLRFDTVVANVAQSDLVLGSPVGNPLYEFSPCHGHYHLRGFSKYDVLDALGTPVQPGRKQAFCVLDTFPYVSAPWVPGEPFYSCDDQGLQPGWADVYGSGLDCQWLDVTNLPAGGYVLRVTVNPEGVVSESNLSNNATSVPVTLPPTAGLPPRPDGVRVPGTPLDVFHAGMEIRVTYDIVTCPAQDYNLYYGIRAGAWSYTYAGAACGLGTSGNVVVDLPDPAPGQVMWFLVVGLNVTFSPDREGGHGFDSSGVERPLTGVGFCGVGATQSGPTCVASAPAR